MTRLTILPSRNYVEVGAGNGRLDFGDSLVERKRENKCESDEKETFLTSNFYFQTKAPLWNEITNQIWPGDNALSIGSYPIT